MYNVFKKHNIYNRLILFLIIFQSCGIRLFDGIGLFLSIIIFLLLIVKVHFTFPTIIKIIVFPLLSFFFFYLKEVTFSMIFNILLIIVNTIIFIRYTNQKGKATFSVDFEFVLKVICIHAAFNAVLDLILPKSLLLHTNNVILDTSFLYIFYFTHSNLPFLGLTRLSGFMWEPGCLQMFLNIYIFICICKKRRLKEFAYVFLLIFLTGSTAGYIILLINIAIYLYTNKQVRLTLLILLVSVMIVPILYVAISDKMTMGNSSSATIRYRDTYIGMRCLLNHPIIGIDFSDIQNSREIQKYEEDVIYEVYGNVKAWFYSQGTMAGGYTNGLFLIFMIWGVAGWGLWYSFARCRLWSLCSPIYPYFIPIIIALSMISEPISNTFFFYFFSLYNLLTKDKLNFKSQSKLLYQTK